MKNIFLASLVVVCASVACKARQYNSEEQSFVNSASNARFTVGAVYGESGSGWCYFNHDANFKTQTTEHSDPETINRLGFLTQELTQGPDGSSRTAQYAVKITLRRYTKAHPYALDFGKSQNSLSRGQLERTSGQINLVTSLMNRLSTYQNRAALRSMSAVLCSPESLTAAGQIAQVAQALNPEIKSAARLAATCNGQPTGVEKEFASAQVIDSADYPWFRKTVARLNDFNPKLGCPAEYSEFEVSNGKFLRWL